MDYYEELGLTSAAGVEEIRQAYRCLAQILHPDRQTEPHLREAAEWQMKRLNAMMAVLTDPEQRVRYDAYLLNPRLRAADGQLKYRLWFAALASLALLLGLWLVCIRNAAEPLPAALWSGPPPPPEALLQAGTRRANPSRRRPPVVARHVEIDAPGAEPQLPGTATPLPAPAAGAAEAGGQAPAEAPALSREPANLAGDWFYVAPPHRAAEPGAYPPAYVELFVTECGGRIRGRYRAKYEVLDRAISPTVDFEFSGDADGVNAAVPWNGPDGTTGEIRLKLASSNVLEVDWKTNRSPKDLGLAAGKCKLVRRHVP